MSLTSSLLKIGLAGLCAALIGVGCTCGPSPTNQNDAGVEPPNPSIAFASLPNGAVQCSDDTDPATAGEQIAVDVVLENGADCTTVTVSNSRNTTSGTATFDANGKASVTVTLVGAASPGAQNPLTATCTTSAGKALQVAASVADACTATPTECVPVVAIDQPAAADAINLASVPGTTTIAVHAGISNANVCNPSADQNALVETGIVVCTATAGATAGQADQIALTTGAATDTNLQLPAAGATTIACTLQDNPTTPLFTTTASASVDVTVTTAPPPGCVVTFPTQGGTFGVADDTDHDASNGISLPLNGTCPANNPATYSLTCDGQSTFTGNLTVTPNGDGTFHIATTLDPVFGPNCSLQVHMDALQDPPPVTYTIDAQVPHLNVTLTPPVGSNGFYDLPDDTVTATTDVIDVPATIATVAFPTGTTFTATILIFDHATQTTTTQTVSLGDGTQTTNVVIKLPVGDDKLVDVDVSAVDDSNGAQVGVGASGSTVKVDTVAPTVTNFFPNSGVDVNLGADTDGNPANGLQASLVFTVSPDAATCVVSLDGVNVPANQVVVGGTTCVAQNVLLAPDGPHQLAATVTDLAGHVTALPAITFQSDGTVPTVTSVCVDQTTACGAVLNIANNGNVATGGNVTVTFTLVVSTDLNGQTITVTTPTGSCTGTVAAGTAHVSGCTLAQGNNTIAVTGADAGGNAIPANSATVLVDTVAPTCTVASPAAGTLLAANDANTATAGMQQNVTIASDANVANGVTILDNGAQVGQCTAAGGGCASVVTIGEGNRSLTASCTDAAGNVTTSPPIALTVDSTVPTCTLTTSTNVHATDDLDAVTAGVQVNASVTCTGLGAGRALTFDDDVEGAINDGACASAADGTAVTCRISYTQSGTHHVAVAGTEASGNPLTSNTVTVAVATGTFNVTVDNPPILNGFRAIGVAQDSDNNPANGAQVIVTGTTDAPNGSVVEVLVKGVAAVTTCTVNNGAISCTPITFTDGDSGSFEVTVTNAAETGTSGVRTFEVDLNRPTVTITNPATASVVFNKASDVVPGGPLDVDVTVNVTGCQNGTAQVKDGTTVIGSATVAASGNATGLAIRATTSHEADAESWTVTCTDADGNTPATIPGFTAKVDITAPSSPTITSTVLDVRKGIVQFNYTQPGDDNNAGTATTVAMFCSKTTISDANFGTGAGQIAIPVPQNTGGTAETPTSPAQSLAFDNSWFCALRATDDAGNTSTLATTSFTIATQQLVLNAPAGVAGYAQALSRSAGDINGDGIDDIVVGAPDQLNGFSSSPGAFEVVLGAGTAGGIARTLVGPPATVPCTEASPCAPTNVGFQVNILKSINGDAFDDVAVVTAPNQQGDQFVLIYAGGPNGIAADQQPASVLQLPAVDAGSVFLPPITVGDVDGDGDLDWVIQSTAGNVYVFLNNGVFPASGLVNARATTTITNSNTNDGIFGAAVAPVGKLADGDQRADFVVTDAGKDPVRMFLIHGLQTWPATLDVATLTGGDVVALGEPASSSAGFDITAGDVDGDSIIDVGYLSAGGVTVIKGTGVTFSGESSFSVLVSLGSGAGVLLPSVNGDARADIIGGGQQPTSLYMGRTPLASNNAPDVSYGNAAAGVNTFEYTAVNLINTTADPDIVIADSDPPGSVTIRF
jgi:hypothetical protein